MRELLNEADAKWNTRAIEAECRVPEGYVPVPVEPSDSQLDVAVSFALNVRICSDYNWSAYMRDVYARMLAAAPKPEKAEPERKLNSEPTIAAPVAQEPVAWREFDGEGGYDYRSYEDNESFRDDYRKRNPQSTYHNWVEPLYLAPPDQSAEVEHWRKKCLNNYLCINAQDKRIAELEAEVERLREYHEGYKEEVMDTIEELRRQQAVLVEALETCTPEGFCDYAACSAALASVKGNAELRGRPLADGPA